MTPFDPTILAIDDAADNLAELEALLAEVMPRARLLVARNGESGLELALTADPDVVVLDLVMPGMDGFEVCRRLKGDARLEHIPVVFLTPVQADRRNRMRALALGAEGFLATPVDALELEAQVRAMAKIKAGNVRRRRENERLAELVEIRARELEREFEARQRAEQDYRTLFREMREAFAVHEMVFDDQGKPVDYRFVAVNPAFEALTGLAADDVFGRTVLDLMPGTEGTWIDTYARVVLTGEPAVFEGYSQVLGRHFSVSAFRTGPNRFACVFTDTSGRVRQAHELNNSLAIILNCAELIQEDAPAGSATAVNATAVIEAAERVRKIVRDPLAPARRGAL